MSGFPIFGAALTVMLVGAIGVVLYLLFKGAEMP